MAKELDLEKWDCTPTGRGEEWACEPASEQEHSGQVEIPQQTATPLVDASESPTIDTQPAPPSVRPESPIRPPDEYEWLMQDIEENLHFVRSLPVSFYVVQVAAFSTFERALTYQESRPDFAFRSVRVASSNGTFHVILLNAHPTYDQAQREADAFSDRFGNPRPLIRSVESLIKALM